MTMATSAYRTKYSEAQTVKLLIAGFTGNLKGWWDNYLTNSERIYITEQVKQEGDQAIPIMVETLILAIIHNFIGDPQIFDQKTSILLHNLRCPTLGDFRWYHDNFITMVVTREDCKEVFWKEKFIAGLPPNFADKVREKLAQLCPSLPLKEITYGRISSAIKMTGLEICSNMKIEQQIKKNNEKGIRELGNFCLQYGYEKPSPPSAQQRKLIKRRKSFNKNNNKPFRNGIRALRFSGPVGIYMCMCEFIFF